MVSDFGPLIAVDVGNSRIKIGIFVRVGDCSGLPAPAAIFEYSASDFDCQRLQSDLIEAGISIDSPATWHIATVNQAPTDRLVGWLKARNATAVKRADNSRSDTSAGAGAHYRVLTFRDLPISIELAQPERVGIDRLLGAVAANRLRDPARRAIVVDVGSAITVDLVSSAGAFLGGAILPGIAMAARAMHQFTDRLPLIPMDELADPPDALGRGTAEAMRSGLYWGSIGAMKELIARLCEPAGGNEPAAEIFLTGGAAPVVAGFLDSSTTTVAHLILGGIALVSK